MRLTRARFKMLVDQALGQGSKVYVRLDWERLRVRAVTLLRHTGVRLHHAASASTGASSTVVRSLMPTGARCYLGWDEDANPTMIVIGPARIRRMAVYGPECVTFDERGLIGQQFGKLTITETRGWNKRQRMVMCRCECGGTKLARYSSLLRGWVKSCGCLRGKNTELPLEPGACYGQLTIIEKVPRPFDARKKEGHYRVRCVCGGEHVRGREVIVGRKNGDCGCGGYVALAGQRFGRLTALNQTQREGRQRLMLTRCDCGVETFARVGDLFSGKKKSCGCLKARLPAPRAA